MAANTSMLSKHSSGQRPTESIPTSMKALVKGGPYPGAELRIVPIPTIGPLDVLIEVRATSICGTDVHIYEWDPWAQGRVHPPLVFGHECAGVVVAIGDSVDARVMGQFVAVETHVVCDHCYQCTHGLRHICRNVQIIGVDRQGAFAEYVSVPAANVWPTDPILPPSIATIQEPMGNAVHTALAQPLAGTTVAIFGAGPIGLFTVPIARSCGAAKIFTVEPSPIRRELARVMGSDVVVDPTQDDVVELILDQTHGEGVDVVLEMSGNAGAIGQALQVLRYGGDISLLGIPSRPLEIDLADGVIFKGATIRGISGRRLWETWYQTRGFLQSGLDLAPIITHQLPLEDFASAFELVRTGRSGKVVMYPNEMDKPL